MDRDYDLIVIGGGAAGLAQATRACPAWSLAVRQAAARFFGGYGGRAARPARAEDRQH